MTTQDRSCGTQCTTGPAGLVAGHGLYVPSAQESLSSSQALQQSRWPAEESLQGGPPEAPWSQARSADISDRINVGCYQFQQMTTNHVA